MNPQPSAAATLAGIALVTVAGFMLAGMDGIAKGLMTEVTAAQAVWARYFFSFAIVGAFYAATRQRVFTRPRMAGWQILRGLCLMSVTASVYFAIQTASLADATAIMFFSPVLVTLLAGVVLGERVTLVSVAAVLLGFVGVLFIVRPGFAGFDPALLVVLIGALGLAVYFVLTRYVRRADNEPITMFHSVFAGAVVTSVIVPFDWVPPSAGQWGIMLFMGLLGWLGHLAIVKAFHLTTASVLSPFLNSQLLAAAIYSVIFYDDHLEWSFYAGSALIVGAGLMVWVQQRGLARAADLKTGS